MTHVVPPNPKIYHIVHVDRLPSILQDGSLLCDETIMARSQNLGTTIGMNHIKERRLQTALTSHPDLRVGQCVPFYFCNRSVMLFVIYRRNPELNYRGGQEPIIHLEFDLNEVASWAQANRIRYAFTLSNAGNRYFEDRADLARLIEVNWPAMEARFWSEGSLREGRQAEFLVENSVPWSLVRRIGVMTQRCHCEVVRHLNATTHKPPTIIEPSWYY